MVNTRPNSPVRDQGERKEANAQASEITIDPIHAAPHQQHSNHGTADPKVTVNRGTGANRNLNGEFIANDATISNADDVKQLRAEIGEIRTTIEELFKYIAAFMMDNQKTNANPVSSPGANNTSVVGDQSTVVNMGQRLSMLLSPNPTILGGGGVGRTPAVGSLPITASATHSNYSINNNNHTAQQLNTSMNNSYSGSLSKLGIKLKQPESFSGRPGTQAIALYKFETELEIYLDAAKISYDDPESLSVALSYLKDHALMWFTNIRRHDPSKIKTWKDLKQALDDRYLPKAQEQISLNDLLDVKYKGSIEVYNNEFMNQLLFLPNLYDQNNEKFVMGLYAKGIKGRGTTYLSNVVQNAINRGEAKNINELMSQVQLAEQSMKLAADNSGNSFRNKVGRNYYPLNFKSSNNNSNASSSDSHYSPVRFQTPQKPATARFNNITGDAVTNDESDGLNDYSYEEEVLHHVDAGAELDNELGVNASDGSNGDEQIEDGESFLNAIRIYEKAKKANPKLSPQELERRKRNNTCFVCNKPGHFANKCSNRAPGTGPNQPNGSHNGPNQTYQKKNH